MAKQHTTDFRESLLAALDAGLPFGEAVDFFHVSARTIRRWNRRRRETGSAAAKDGRGRRSQIGAAEEATLRAQVVASPDATLAELGDRLAEVTGIRVSPSTICRRLQTMKLTRTKRP